MKNKFMEIKNQTDSSADIYFYGDIVSSEWSKWEDTDTAPEDVRNFLAQVDNVENLNIYINSGGGSVFAGLAIYNMLKRHKGYKTAYIDGLGASIASVIPMAADKIVMPSNAFLMIHKPWNGMYGNANDFRKMADDLDVIETGIINVYAENLKDGVDIEDIKAMVNAETWLNGIEAAKYFNIEVAEENKMVACSSDYFKNYSKVPSEVIRKEEAIHSPENKVEEEVNALLLKLELI